MTQLPLVDFLAVDTATPGTWTLHFPAPDKILSINTAKHWRVTAPNKKTWRDAMYVYAQQAHLPKGLTRARIDVVLQFPTAGRRDTANYLPYSVKALVDALGPGRQYRSRSAGVGMVTELGYGLIPDDDPVHLDGPHLTFGPPIGRRKGYGRVTITITDLTP